MLCVGPVRYAHQGDDQTSRQMTQMAIEKTIKIIFMPHTVIEIQRARWSC